MRGTHPYLPERTLGRRRLSQQGKTARDCLLLTGAGVALAGVEPGGCPMPFAACLILAQPFGLRSLAAALGAIGGYFFRLGGVEAMEQIAMCVLCLAAVAVFQGTSLPARPWFWPIMAAGISAVLGSVGLLGGRDQIPAWMVQWVCAGAGAAVFRGAMQGKQKQQMILLAFVAGGLAGTPKGFDLGLVLGFALCSALRELFPCAVVAAALDICGSYEPAMTLCLLIPGVLCSFGAWSDTFLTVCFLIVPWFAWFLTGTINLGLVLGSALGVAAGTILRLWKYVPLGLATEQKNVAAARLESAAGILDLLRQQLPRQETTSVSEAESIYDGAAEQVCRCCGRFHRCWEQRGRETFTALMAASKPMIQRGMALPEDFSREFQESCCHFEGFLTAVNQELEGMLFRRRFQMELRESREVLSEELVCLSEFLRSVMWEEENQPAVYRPLVGACTLGKEGSRISGDRGACFAGNHQDYYVLLCDGMGTGKEASKSGGETLHLLEHLLRSGLGGEAALKILNATELLQASDRFTTVDLLEISLVTGKATLYKWGAAPSYWRSGETLKKIGTASPPPGVGVGENHKPEEYPLSLRRGEMVVLVSDGAVREETEAVIGAYEGSSVHELAALLISGLPGEDDCSAVVVSLRPISS